MSQWNESENMLREGDGYIVVVQVQARENNSACQTQRVEWRLKRACCWRWSPGAGDCPWGAARGRSRGCRWCVAATVRNAARSRSSVWTMAAISCGDSCAAWPARRRGSAAAASWPSRGARGGRGRGRGRGRRGGNATRLVRCGARRRRHCRRAAQHGTRRALLADTARYLTDLTRSLRSLRIELRFRIRLFPQTLYESASNPLAALCIVLTLQRRDAAIARRRRAAELGRRIKTRTAHQGQCCKVNIYIRICFRIFNRQ